MGDPNDRSSDGGAVPGLTAAARAGKVSASRRLLRNAMAMASSQAITWVVSFVLLVYLSRALGAANYGKLQFVLSLVAIFTIVADFGTSTLVIREVARDLGCADAILTNVLALKCVTGAVSLAALIGLVLLMHRPPEVIALTLVMGGGMLLFSTRGFLASMLQGFEEMHYAAAGRVIEKLVEAAGIVLVLACGAGLVPIAWAMVAAGVAHLLWCTRWLLPLARPRLSLLSWGRIRRLVAGSLPFFAYAALYQIYDQIGIVLLAVMAGDMVVGWYAAAYRLFATLYILPTILVTVTFPVLSRLWTADREAYRQAVHRTFAILCVAAVAVGVAGAALAGPIVEAVYSRAAFAGTVSALRLLMPALACRYMNALFVMILQTTDRETRWLKAATFAAIANLAANLLLIPRMGHVGAALATAMTDVLLMGLALRACPPGTLRPAARGILTRCLLAGAALAAVMVLSLRLHHPMAGGLLGLGVYGVMLRLLGVVGPNEVAALRKALPWRREPGLGTVSSAGTGGAPRT